MAQSACSKINSDVLTDYELNSLDISIYGLVHSHKGGAEALAPQIHKRPSSLNHEVKSDAPSHKLGLIDAVRLMKITENPALLIAIAQITGYTLIPNRKFEGCSDIEVLTAYATWQKENGDVAKAVLKAFEDSQVTHKEYAYIMREGMETIAAFHAFMQRVEGLLVK